MSLLELHAGLRDDVAPLLDLFRNERTERVVERIRFRLGQHAQLFYSLTISCTPHALAQHRPDYEPYLDFTARSLDRVLAESAPVCKLKKVPARAPEHRTGPAAFPEHCVLVSSPMVGIFYCAPEPGAQPFVEVGQRVEADTTVCIIEVMKLMNSIPAGHSGIVKQILVGDAELVEEGQVLMVIGPPG